MNFPTKTKLIKLVQKQALFFFFLLLNFNICAGQNLGGSLKIAPGYSFIQVKDTRHSSIFRTVPAWNFGMQYELQGERSANVLGFKVLPLQGAWKDGLVTMAIVSETRIFYEHVRTLKNKNWQLGAYLDHGVFSTDRQGGSWFGFDDDPSLSYVIWSSLGVMGKYHKTLNENWSLHLQAGLPLLAFTERPSYAFVFPEDHYGWTDYFLVFQSAYFQRAKFQTFTQFTDIQLQAALQHRIGRRGNSIGANYQLGYLFASGVKPLFRVNHNFTLTYQFSFKKS